MPRVATTQELPKREGNKYVTSQDFKPYKQRRFSKFSSHKFLCFDGEGMNLGEDERHHYVYLAAFDGEEYSDYESEDGLNTIDCFSFLMTMAKEYPDYICVIYGGSYDANMMLGDLSQTALEKLRETNSCNWRQYRIEYVPWKYFQVTDRRRKITCRLWDVIGFFQSSFEKSLDGWLDVSSSIISKGKAKRSKFTIEDLPEIIDYCKEELKYFEKLCQRLWECLDGANIRIKRWDGTGSIAQTLLSNHNIINFKGTEEQQNEHYFFARCAYAGGRFENCQPGDFKQTVYGYDINSAYPYAISQLPSFRGLTTCRKREHNDCRIGEYDLLRIKYEADISLPIHPYFHRGRDLSISYPNRHHGYHWAPEYLEAIKFGDPGDIVEHYKWRDYGDRPFKWVNDLYEQRLFMKEDTPDNPYDAREKVLKLGINSLYGKMAQQRGWKEGRPLPRFHQLYWAGWVTAKCRSMVYAAMMQAPDKIIACETDGIISMVPLDLPTGKALGEWELTKYDWITYVQSGLYFAGKDGKEVKLRSRGINAKSISRQRILAGWAKYQKSPTAANSKIATFTTRFHTLASSVATGNMEDWRQWRKQKREISLIPLPTGKRSHLPTLCGAGCTWGEGHHHRTFARPMHNDLSEPYKVIWLEDEDEIGPLEDMYLAREMWKEEQLINE